MRASYVITFLIASVTAAWTQTVYYATFTGGNYATQTWHSSSLAAFKAAPPDDVYDSYTVERHSDGTTVVHRNYTTLSGDWRFELTTSTGATHAFARFAPSSSRLAASRSLATTRG